MNEPPDNPHQVKMLQDMIMRRFSGLIAHHLANEARKYGNLPFHTTGDNTFHIELWDDSIVQVKLTLVYP